MHAPSRTASASSPYSSGLPLMLRQPARLAVVALQHAQVAQPLQLADQQVPVVVALRQHVGAVVPAAHLVEIAGKGRRLDLARDLRHLRPGLRIEHARPPNRRCWGCPRPGRRRSRSGGRGRALPRRSAPARPALPDVRLQEVCPPPGVQARRFTHSQRQAPVQLLGRQRLLGRGRILGVEVVVRAALRVHLGLHWRTARPRRGRAAPTRAGRRAGSRRCPARAARKRFLKVEIGRFLSEVETRNSWPPASIVGLTALRNWRQLRHEVGLVHQRQRAGVGAAGLGGEGQGARAVGEDPARLVAVASRPGRAGGRAAGRTCRAAARAVPWTPPRAAKRAGSWPADWKSISHSA